VFKCLYAKIKETALLTFLVAKNSIRADSLQIPGWCPAKGDAVDASLPTGKASFVFYKIARSGA
jgi:hypothetical protein